MKQVFTLFTFVLFFVLYSCNSDGINKEVDEGILKKQKKTTITTDNDNCNFSAEKIGKNSNNQSPVELIGLYENIRNTRDHSYGYAISLWKLDEEILGFFSLYEGGIEPNRSGPIVNGNITNDSLHFTVWTKKNKGYSDWQQSEVHIFSFSGKLTKDQLVGGFIKFNCTDKTLEEKYDEQVALNASNIWELKSYENIQDWKENYSYQLDYEE